MAHFHVDSEFDAEFEHAMKQVFEDSGKILQMQDDGDMAEEGVKSAAEKVSSWDRQHEGMVYHACIDYFLIWKALEIVNMKEFLFVIRVLHNDFTLDQVIEVEEPQT